jgi:hypothetical protein
MNDPWVGFVVGLFMTVAFCMGYRLGGRGMAKSEIRRPKAETEERNGHPGPVVRASWLKRNVFKPEVVEQANLKFENGRLKSE